MEINKSPSVSRRTVSIFSRKGPSPPASPDTALSHITPGEWLSQSLQGSSRRRRRSLCEVFSLDGALRRPSTLKPTTARSRAEVRSSASDTEAKSAEQPRDSETSKSLKQIKSRFLSLQETTSLSRYAASRHQPEVPIMSRPRPVTPRPVTKRGRPIIRIQIPASDWKDAISRSKSAGVLDQFPAQRSVAPASLEDFSLSPLIHKKANMDGPWSSVSPVRLSMTAQLPSDNWVSLFESWKANDYNGPTSLLPRSPRVPSSSGSSVATEEASSRRSMRSSVTSVYSDPAQRVFRKDLLETPGMTGSVAFSIVDPVSAGVFDDARQTIQPSKSDSTATLVASDDSHRAAPSETADQRMPVTNAKQLRLDTRPDPVLRMQKDLEPRQTPPSAKDHGGGFMEKRGPFHLALDLLEEDFAVNRAPRLEQQTPTLSEAESDLQWQLSAITQSAPFPWDNLPSPACPCRSPPPTPVSELSSPKSDTSRRMSRTAYALRSASAKISTIEQYAGRSGHRLSKGKSHDESWKNRKADANRYPSEVDGTAHVECLQLMPPTPPSTGDESRYRNPFKQGLIAGKFGSLRKGKAAREESQTTRSASLRFGRSRRRIPSKLELMQSERTISSEAAEKIVLKILESTSNLDSLFSVAVTNRGFYRVFKRHELHLMKAVLQTECAPAWELRELILTLPDGCSPDAPTRLPEYTPSSYLQCYTRDLKVVIELKTLIREHCYSFLRPQTIAGLSGTDAVKSGEVDNAIWRIWTFCTLFGSRKGREGDIVAQLEWLKGGKMTLQTKPRASIMETGDPVSLSSALLNAPESFGRGNGEGLSAEQLFDMLEIWTCLGVLIAGIQGEGRAEQARKYGVFCDAEGKAGDLKKEELLLEEWMDHLLTLGPSVILSLHPLSKSPTSSVFIAANRLGWTSWDPCPTGSFTARRVFLKDAVTRLYEERMAACLDDPSTRTAQRVCQKQRSHQRSVRHIEDLWRQRLAPDHGSRPPISNERPMSDWANTGPLSIEGETWYDHTDTVETRQSEPFAASPSSQPVERPASTAGPPAAIHSRHARTASEPIPLQIKSSAPAFEYTFPHPPRAATQPISGSTPSKYSSPSMRSRQAVRKSYEDIRASRLRRAAKDQTRTPFQHNSVDEALFRLVDMGFTPDKARWALAKTDDGGQLSLERAVALLLR